MGTQLSPPPKKNTGHSSPPTFRLMYCGQTAGWIKMSLGTEADEDPALPLQKGHRSPSIFHPRLLWPNGWMDQDETWYEVRPKPWPSVRRGSSPLAKGHSPAIFGPCLLWPKGCMDQDATCYGRGLGTGHIVLDMDPAPPKMGHSTPLSLFGPCLL